VTPATETARPADDVRQRTIAMHLWLLGYLDEEPAEDERPPVAPDAFRAALRQFRREAGIEANGDPDAIDDPTWYALNELVTVEGMRGTGLTVERLRERWFEDGEPRPALQRAVQLRLSVLGLRDEGPAPSLDPPRQETLMPFLRVYLLFRMGEDSLPQGYFPETIAALFDQDRFVEALSRAGTGDGGFALRRPQGLSEERAQTLARAFIVNVAKVELWLLGFEVDPDGETDYRVSGVGGASRRSDLRAALREYWQELEDLPRDTARERADSISPLLFRSLQKTAEAADAVETDPHADVSREVVEEHLTTEQEIERAWAEVKTRRLSLWDGLKRVWRWIKRGVKKVVSWIGSFFKNVARAFYRYATKAYKIVRLAVTSVVESVEYYVEGRLATRPDAQVVLLNESDFDASLYVHPEAGGEAMGRFRRRLRRKTTVFAVGARVLGIAFRTIRHLALGIAGWARLLKSLVHSLRELKPTTAA
jgi:hypothetical protein